MLLENVLTFLPSGRFERRTIQMDNGRITALTLPGPDAGGPVRRALPGFVDVHIHGAAGADCSDGKEEGLDAISRFLVRRGVTSFLATTLTLPAEQLEEVCAALGRYAARPNPGAQCRGIHLEGPFFHPEMCGAQRPDALALPDTGLFERLWARAGEAIRILSLAPELPGADELIERAAPRTTVSLAHTTAGYECACRAYRQGASHATHLFNAMPPLHHRKPGVIGAAFDHARQVELICDGQHVSPPVLRMAFALFGARRICCISDAMRACGLADGHYTLGGLPVTVREGQARLANGALAGSATDLYTGFRQLLDCGIPPEQAIASCSATPARAIGLAGEIGALAPGMQADVLLTDLDFGLEQVFLGGAAQL